MPRLIPLPDEFSDRPFSIAEAGEAGIRAGRLRSPDLRIPFRAVRAPRDLPVDVEALCAGFGLQMAPDQFFSHVTAARLHGLPLPLRLERALGLDVAVELPAQCPRMRGVRGHRVTVCGVTTLRGHRVASPVDVWCQLSTVLDLDELIMVGDALVRRIHPLATMDELRGAVLGHSGHPRGQQASGGARMGPARG